jgi:uncharacterized protein DUF5906
MTANPKLSVIDGGQRKLNALEAREFKDFVQGTLNKTFDDSVEFTVNAGKFLTATCREDGSPNKFFYIIHDLPILRGNFGHYIVSDTKTHKWEPLNYPVMTAIERKALEAQCAEELKHLEVARSKQSDAARSELYEEYKKMPSVTLDHPYLRSKKLDFVPSDWKLTEYKWSVPFGPDGSSTRPMNMPTIFIPRYALNKAGQWEFVTGEFVSEWGKRSATGVKIRPYGVYPLGILDPAKPIYVGEGGATILTAYLAMEREGCFLSARSKGDIPKVLKDLRTRLPEAEIVLLGELEQLDSYQGYGREHRAKVAVPVMRNGSGGTDFNDVYASYVTDGSPAAALEEVREQINRAALPTVDPAAAKSSAEKAAEARQHSSIITEAEDKFFNTYVNPQYATVGTWGGDGNLIVKFDQDKNGRQKLIILSKDKLGTGLASMSRQFRAALEDAFIVKNLDPPDNLRVGEVHTQWLKSPSRKHYTRVAFDPEWLMLKEGQDFNLWRGYSVAPSKSGSWKKLRKHLFRHVCRRDRRVYRYILDWLAYRLQYPGRPMQVALVLTGEMGVGKSIIFEQFGELFASNFIVLDSESDLTGDFTGHFEAKILVVCEEIVWAGNRAMRNKLFTRITGKTASIHHKGRTPTQEPNVSAWVLVTNATKSVELTAQDRRFLILDVEDQWPDLRDEQRRQAQVAYFGPMVTELDAGGRGRMLHDLLARDVSQFEPRLYPSTSAIKELKAESLDSVAEFLLFAMRANVEGGLADWQAELEQETEKGKAFPPPFKAKSILTGLRIWKPSPDQKELTWLSDMPTKKLVYAAYTQRVRDLREEGTGYHRPEAENIFWRKLKALLPLKERKVNGGNTGPACAVCEMSLAETRALLIKQLGLEDDDDLFGSRGSRGSPREPRESES